MQRGGSSADVWVQQGAASDEAAAASHSAPVAAARLRLVTSRSAENLYWLGRYTERSENTVRLARLCLNTLNAEEPPSDRLWSWLHSLCEQQHLVPMGVAFAPTRKRLFERTLVANLDQDQHVTSVGYNLRALQRAASSLRERLSPEHWHAIVHGVDQFSADCHSPSPSAQPDFSTAQALHALDGASSALAAITGAQTDRMTRDDGWQLLSIGRHVERLGFLSSVLTAALQTGALQAAEDAHAQFEALLALFDSTITFHAQYQQSRALADLLSLLVLDAENPRALAWVTRSLRARINKLADAPRGEPDALAAQVPDLGLHQAEALSASHESKGLESLSDLLQACTQCAWDVSDALTARYFSHSETTDTVGV
jgi:uncharacterized alpha-E superfamily protein